MPIVTQRFDSFPIHMDSELRAIYALETFFCKPDEECPITKIKHKVAKENTVLYISAFSNRWLAAAIVTGDSQARRVEHLCVHASARLMGIGRKLLDEIRRLESLAGNEQLVTTVSPNDYAAHSFLSAVEAAHQFDENSTTPCSELTVPNHINQQAAQFNLM